MAVFEYKAIDKKGKQQKGLMEADSPKQLRQLLRGNDLVPLEVTAVAKENNKKKNNKKESSRTKVKAKDLAIITRQLATLVQSGSPIEEALATAAKQTDKPNVKSVISSVRSKVIEGHSLAAGLRSFPNTFPELYCATVAAGEKSGHLDAILERLADYTESRQVMQQKVTNALVYPVILIIMALGIVTVLLTYVVPQIIKVFENMDQELPALTQIVLNISDFVQNYGIILFGIFLALAYSWSKLLQIYKWKYRYHQFLLKIPIIGTMAQGLNTARFTRTLSILSASGVSILEALTISGQVMENLPMRKAIEETTIKVREGLSIYKALEQSGYFPPMTVYLIASGESSGELDSMLERAAVQQERETDSLLATILSLFEPILILVMGLIVLFIVLAVLLPIFNMNSLIK